MKYVICSTIELAKFCADRKLEVQHKVNSLPNRDDYLKALRQGDKKQTFRFLDLAPELRNHVYDNLLVFKNSFTCSPAILGTCREINEEASSVLYGNNLIEVKIWKDGVYANGWRCGTYSPSNPDFTQLWWPTFLTRSKHIRFAVGADFVDDLDSITRHSSPRALHRRSTIENVFFSLCKYLSKGHRLLSLDIDETRKNSLGQIVAVPFYVRATRMLGRLKRLTIDGARCYGGCKTLPKNFFPCKFKAILDFMAKRQDFYAAILVRYTEISATPTHLRSRTHTRTRAFIDSIGHLMQEPADGLLCDSNRQDEAFEEMKVFFRRLRQCMERLALPLDRSVMPALDKLLEFEMRGRTLIEMGRKEGKLVKVRDKSGEGEAVAGTVVFE